MLIQSGYFITVMFSLMAEDEGGFVSQKIVQSSQNSFHPPACWKGL